MLPPRHLWKDVLFASEGVDPTPSQLVRLGQKFTPEAARWAIEQWHLRDRAKPKFDLARAMLFVREGLEQATPLALARYHASKFPAGTPVLDATVGIGADLIALAERGPTLGCDLDPIRLVYAQWNLEVYGVHAGLVVADCMQFDWSRQAVFVDPSRRDGGKRSTQPEDFSPDPEQCAQRLAASPHGGLMKLSPLLHDDTLLGYSPSVEFVSHSGECKEALLAYGPIARPGVWAVHAATGEALLRTDEPAVSEQVQEFLLDPDPALVRAHAQGHFGASALGVPWGYLTQSEPIQSPWLKSYRVLATGAYDPKRLSQELKHLGSSTPILKQRGTKLDLQKLRQQFRLAGENPLSVAFFPVGRSIRFAILENA